VTFATSVASYRRDEVTDTADEDAATIAALRQGDERAFAQLVDQHGAAMLRVARVYFRGNDDAAGDVVQEAWLAALRSLKSFEGRSSIKTWLLGIVNNVARSRRRRESRVAALSLLLSGFTDRQGAPTVDPARFQGRADGDPGAWRVPPAPWSDLPESRLLGQEALDEVARAIAALPESQRVVIQMRDVEGLDAAAVARAVGISDANVRVRLHRARASVRARLETYFGQVPS
jgi:RNA polymerase sigma-70 factor (ECF subfamily)